VVVNANDVLPTLVLLAVTSPERVPGAAAGMPTVLVERLNQDIYRVLKLLGVRERMAAEGTLPVGGTPAQFGELVRSELEKWRRIIRQAAIVPDSR
jgi:tripartite-type tricarboxylate transporter receptor subunit TctC